MTEGYAGKNFLIKKETSTPDTYAVIGGMRSTSLSLNNEMIDVTNKDNMPWRTLIEGGIQSMSASLAGVFNDNSVLAEMMALAHTGAIKNYQLVDEAGDEYQGPFKITKLDRGGEHGGEETYSISLESAGEIEFTPAAP